MLNTNAHFNSRRRTHNNAKRENRALIRRLHFLQEADVEEVQQMELHRLPQV